LLRADAEFVVKSRTLRRSKMETGREYIEGLKKQIEAMSPLEQIASAMMLYFAEVVVGLINERQWQAIDAMKEMATEIFEQADELKHEKKHVQ
jgi:hypothetical protein